MTIRPSRHPQIQIHIHNHIRTPLDFNENHPIDTVLHSDHDALIRFSPHSKLWRPEASKVFFWGRGTPLEFHKKQGICAVFHADCDGKVRFLPHSKMAPLEPLKKIEGLGDPLRFL